MRILKAIIAVLVVTLIIVSVVGCQNSPPTATPAATKQVKVTMGTISNAVTGTATLGLAKTQDLAFEMAGYVDQILVDESDSVTKGQLLATLDTSAFDTQIDALKKSLASAQRSLTTRQNSLVSAQRVLTTKQTALTKAQNAAPYDDLIIKQKEMNLESAQFTLDNIAEVKAAQATVDSINNSLQFAETNIKAAVFVGDSALANQWREQKSLLNDSLLSAQARLDKVLRGSGVSSTNVALQISQAVLAVEQAQKNLADAQSAKQTALDDAKTAVANAQYAVDDAKTAVDNAQLDVNDAQSAVADAQTKLEEQQALSPTINAPFDGFITAIKLTGGAQVYKGTVALQIADPNQFQASFMVSETDIFSVKVGQSAVVSVDALSNQTFPAKVTAIAPLATVTSGVVNYRVTAELTSLIPIAPGFGGAGGPFGGAFSGTFPAGARPSGMPTALPSGFTRPSGVPTGAFPSGTAAPSGNGAVAPVISAAPAALKQGLSASVTITIQEKKNVLIVPLRAITTVAGKSTAQVVEGTVTKAAEVTTGLSDASNIEIVSGLTEGQTVIVKSSSSSGSNFFGPGGGMIIR